MRFVSIYNWPMLVRLDLALCWFGVAILEEDPVNIFFHY